MFTSLGERDADYIRGIVQRQHQRQGVAVHAIGCLTVKRGVGSLLIVEAEDEDLAEMLDRQLRGQDCLPPLA